MSTAPAPSLESRSLASYPVDPRVRQPLAPRRVLWTTGEVTDPEHLLRSRRLQVVPAAQPCTRMQRHQEPTAMLLDFGREVHGGVRLVIGSTTDNKLVRLRVRFGESASEAMADPFPTHGHAVHDHLVHVPWCGSHEVGSTGFRFVRIDVVDPGTHVELVNVSATSVMRDLPRLGSFRCSDERLTRIWQVGADTVHLCMQDLLWDGIKRDRLVWIGDMHPETQVISTVFGEHDIVPRSLDFVRDTTPLPGWMNGISSYSLWWLLIQHAWYLQHGDIAYLRAQRAYACGLLTQVLGCIDAEGCERLEGWRFLDWPTVGNEAAIHAGLQGLTVLACEAGLAILEAIGEQGTALFGELAQGLERLRRHRPILGPVKQAAALSVLAGLSGATETNSAILANAPLSGLSTFYGYYVLGARAKAGDINGALEVIRTFWGGMLDRGATSFWEDFNLDWLEGSSRIDELVPAGLKDLHGDYGDHCYKGFRHSLCHGWAAGPTAWLSQHVLGCAPLSPGCRRLQVAPRLGTLDWAEGSYPTPLGVVQLRHERRGGTVHSTITAPPGIEIVRGGDLTP